MVAHYYPPAKDRRVQWTADQDSLLLLHYGSMPLDTLAAKLGKTPTAAKGRMARLRRGCATTNFVPYRSPTQPVTPDAVQRLLDRDTFPVKAAWEQFDDFRLRLFYGERSLPELATLLGRSVPAVKGRVNALHWSLDKAIAFRLEVSRSPLWLEALEALKRAEADKHTAVEAERHYQRTLFRTKLKKIKHITDLPALVSALEDPTV